MTIEQANELLDSIKDGNTYASIRAITEALWTTGDIGRKLPIHTRPYSEDGINEWMESTRMVSGEGIRNAPIGDLQGNQSGIDQNNEGNQ